MPKKATVNDLRLFIGHVGVPNEALDEQGRLQLQAATRRLYEAHVGGVLKLAAVLVGSGLSPLGPEHLIQVLGEPPRRGDSFLRRFNR